MLDAKRMDRRFQDIPDDQVSQIEQDVLPLDFGIDMGFGWPDLLKSRRILIIAEAGTGKTYECHRQQEILWSAGEPAFYLELAALSREDLRNLLSDEQEDRFNSWKNSQTGTATFFLDSIDELRLSLGSFNRALTRLSKAVTGMFGRIRVVVTARPILIDEQLFRQILPVPAAPDETPLDQAFADIAMSRLPQKPPDKVEARDWRRVRLLPLSTEQIKAMATEMKVAAPDQIISDIRRLGIEEFTRRPLDLIELCVDWRENHRLRSHADQVSTNIVVKLKPREDRHERAQLSKDKALNGARRLALAAILCRKLTLRHSIVADRHGDPVEMPLDPSKILSDWSPDELATLLERPLFGFASYGRVRFHHRSVIDYLAAEHLLDLRSKGYPIKAIKRLLFVTTTQHQQVVRPSMRPIAAWMAQRDELIFRELLRREPEVLLDFGDPQSLTPAQRQEALRTYVERYGSGGRRGVRVPIIQLQRFADAALGAEVARLWNAGIGNPEVREALLRLVGYGGMTDCADLAYDVAVDPEADSSLRATALGSLVRLKDSRLAEMCISVAENAALWPDEHAREAILQLFPSHLSADQLCKVLARIDEPKRSVAKISWHLANSTTISKLSREFLEDLRRGFTDLITEGTYWDKTRWPTVLGNKLFLLEPLAVTCHRLLQLGASNRELMHSVAVVSHMTGHRDADRVPFKALATKLAGSPAALRQMVFEAEDAFLMSLKPELDPNARFVRLAYGGALQLSPADRSWILPMLADHCRPPQERAMLLHAVTHLRDSGATWVDDIDILKPLVADLADLLDQLERWAKIPQRSPAMEQLERQIAETLQQQERQDAEDHAYWMSLHREITADPDAVFAEDRAENTAWNIFRVMNLSAGEHQQAGWNRPFIERHFSKVVADRLRLTMMDLWRRIRPTLPSERPKEERNRYREAWLVGLAGVAAEAENPDWVGSLNDAEVNAALRYVPVASNGFPQWLEPLAAARPAAVDAVIGSELTTDLENYEVQHSWTLQNIAYAMPTVARVFIPRLRAWLDNGGWRQAHNQDVALRANRLRRVLDILLSHGDEELTAKLREQAKTELRHGAVDTITDVWLPILMRICPADGIEALETTLEPQPPTKFGPAADWFGALFDSGDRDVGIALSDPGFTPPLLRRLLGLAYLHLRPQDDMVHDETSYTPNARDHAEIGRSRIFNALMGTTGEDAWTIKVELADDPLFTRIKDLILKMALERASEEADTSVYTEAQVIAMDRQDELPPQTRDEMFALLVDRLEDLDETLLQDDSPRAAWALVNDERILRQLIARELRIASRGAYTVDQEAVTADEKETDIRLRSTGSPQEAVIELKVGEKERSAAQLRKALKAQLVTKYMAPENRRAGCFMVTACSDRTWSHPDTEATLNLPELIAMLDEEICRIETNMGGDLRLTARGLNLLPRLQTEQRKKH